MSKFSQSISLIFLLLISQLHATTAKTLVEWLNDEGARIFVICGTSLILFVIWHILCMVIIKGLYIRGARMRKNIILTRLKASRNVHDYAKEHIPVVSVVEDDDNKDDELGGSTHGSTHGSGHNSPQHTPNATNTNNNNNNNNININNIDDNEPQALAKAPKEGILVTHSMSHSLIDENDSDTDTEAKTGPLGVITELGKEKRKKWKKRKLKNNKNKNIDDENSDDYDNLDSIILPEEVKRGVKHRAETFGGVIRNFGTFFIIMITLLQILDTIDVATNSLLIATTLVGFSISLGFYTIISDFASGLFILAENQYFKGENVIINGVAGVVEAQSLRLTVIRSRDGRLHVFTNGSIRQVTNCSRDFAIATVYVTVPYKSESDYMNAKQCLEEIVSRAIKLDKTVDIVSYLEDPFVEGIDEMEGNFMRIKYSIKVQAGTESSVQQAMMKHIRLEFIKNGIYLYKLQTQVYKGINSIGSIGYVGTMNSNQQQTNRNVQQNVQNNINGDMGFQYTQNSQQNYGDNGGRFYR